MFQDYQRRGDGKTGRRFVASTGVALVLYILGAVALLAFAREQKEQAEEAEVQVTFRTPDPPPRPAPPPPPAVAIPPDAKRKPATQSRPIAVPSKEVKKEDLAEADPAQDRFEDPGSGSDVGVGNGPLQPAPAPPPPPPKPKRKEPVNLPENAQPAEPDSGNVMPEYPAEMRAKGVEGLVILKVVVTDGGRVADIQVMRGDEPFVSAALTAVKTWRFTPARLDGEPIAVYRIIKIPFKLAGRM